MDQNHKTPASSGFDFNRPTIVSLLYLASCITGVTALVGVVLAYVWRNEPQDGWEGTHYDYLIRTFWIGLIGSVAGVLLVIVLIGIPVLLATMVLVLIRSVMSLVNAQKRVPMPNPGTWLV